MTLSSCPDERVLSIHADGELPREQAIEVSAHVAACALCGVRLAALRVEDVLLRELIEQPLARPVFAAATPRRELVTCGLLSLPAVALMAAGLAVLGALQLPAGLEWLDPLRTLRPQAWVYALGLWLVQHGPGLPGAVLSLGAVMTLGSLAALGVTARLGRAGAGAIAAGLALCALLPASASALELRRDEHEVRIESGERIEEPLAVATQVFELDGDVDGDLLVVAETIRLRGHVNGNVFAASETLELPEGASIEGSLFFAGEKLEIAGAVRDSSYSLTSRLELGASGRIGQTLAGRADLADLEGHVGQDVFLNGERARLAGRVGRDLVTWATDVSLVDGAVVSRNADAWLGEGDELALAEGAQVLGETQRRSIGTPPSRFGRYGEPSFYLRQLVELGAALLVGLLLLNLVPELAFARVGSARSFFTSAGIGFLALVAVPVAAVICAVTVVGIPLALIAAGVYLIVLYLAQVPVAAWIGAALAGGEAERVTTGQLVLPLFLGLLLLHIASNLPFVGIPIGLLTILVGLGLLAREAREIWRHRSARAARGSSA